MGVTIVTPESWHPDWPLQEANIQFLKIGTPCKVKQRMRWAECIGPEGQKGRLKPYVANIGVYLWDCNLLQQWNTQVNISAVPKTHVSGKNIIKYKQRSPAFRLYKNTKQLANLRRY